MEMRFSGILHAKKSTGTATGVTGNVQINCPLYTTDVVSVFRFHSQKINLSVMAKTREVGEITGRMTGTRTTPSKAGIVLQLSIVCDVDRGFQKLDAAVGNTMDFIIETVEENKKQPELGE